ncbi:putative RNA methyltransferase [Thiofilum flexile]|uniref:putative RNA methyltransferase n=1 Tax=Thiofilum flexile TaxID=125627 RepID=UPI0003608FBE|nr:methyltransferase domain-containing protein [Thiofilum flexile]
MYWRCPVCHSPLKLENTTYRCANGHTHDQAKEGYVNLLLAHQKKSLDPGDNKAMLLSRRLFLEQGHYQPLADALAQYITELTASRPQVLLDIGCGEGYYLNHIAQANPALSIWGIDIARDAARLAAKRLPTLHFAVASSAHLPVADESADIITTVFAPISEAEITRVLKPQGSWLWVRPGTKHLYQLRDLIYTQARLHSTDLKLPDTLQLLSTHPIQYSLNLNNSSSIAALLAMTPYYWSASLETQERINQLNQLTIQIDFQILQLKKLNT